MAESAETEAARVRLFQGIAAAAAQGTGMANAHRIGEQMGLTREQTETLRADLQAAGLLEPAQTRVLVSVTPRGWLWWQRLPQSTTLRRSRRDLGHPRGRGRGT